MAKTNSLTKDQILREFETMKSFELSAHDLYTKVATDLDSGPQKFRTAFASMAADEKRHADLVQEIINIVGNAL
jgi:rubrerythrin